MENRSRPAAVPLCPLVARDAELQRLLELWRSSRLLSVIGQSGVGKSSLARAAADRLATEENAGVRRLEAGGAETGAAFLRLLARARRRSRLPLPAGRDQLPDQQASGAPPDQDSPSPFFLLLDDVTAGARAATRGLLQWLVQNPDVHLLIVTRRPLDLLGERTMSLAPLAFSTDEPSPSPAAELFEWYARLTRQDGSPVAPETVSAICRSLDGLPAALEAAAGLLAVLSERDVARITREEPLSLQLRGRSLREMITSTWNDLPEEARAYLAANAGWSASFSDAAGAAMGGHEFHARAVPLVVQVGLLWRTESESRPRYRIASLMRAWMMEAGLAADTERQERRAHFLLAVAERTATAGLSEREDLQAIRWAWRWLAGRREGEAVVRFAAALSEPLTHSLGEPAEAVELLSSALGWARAAGRETTASLEAALAEAEACRGDLEAAAGRLRRLLERDVPSFERAAAQSGLASVLSAYGQLSASIDLRQEAIAALRRHLAAAGEPGTTRALAWALWGLAEDCRRLGQSESAWTALEESSDLFVGCACDAGRAAVLAGRAALHLDRGETLEALGCARESRSLAKRIGDRPGLARALQISGRIVGRNEPQRGLEPLGQAIALWEEMRRPVDLAAALLDLAALAACRDAGLEQEMNAARRALDLARRHRLAAVEAAALFSLAGTYHRAGQTERAESYAMEAASACEATDEVLVRRLLPFTPSPAHPLTPSPPHPPAPPLLIRLLGPLTVEGPNGALTSTSLRPKEQRVLARLALSPGEVVPRDELLDLFWHRSPVAAAERSLRTVVSSLRASFRPLIEGKPPRLITGRLDGYRLEPESFAVDAELFARAVRAARGTSSGPRSPERALPEWRRAAELYRGDLLLAFQYEDWCLTPRERLRNEYLDVLFRLAQAAMEVGHVEEACSHGIRMVEIDPVEERAYRLLMRCYVFLDRPAEALRQFERCRAALWEELAARPSPATVSLLREIREGVTFSDEDDAALEPATASHEPLFR